MVTVISCCEQYMQTEQALRAWHLQQKVLVRQFSEVLLCMASLLCIACAFASWLFQQASQSMEQSCIMAVGCMQTIIRGVETSLRALAEGDGGPG